MIEINFYRDGNNILTLASEEEAGSSLKKISGDDTWFDYSFKPLLDGEPVAPEENPKGWADALAESYRSSGSAISVRVAVVDQVVDPAPVPPEPYTGDQPTYKNFVLSGWWKRVGALLIDNIIVWTIAGFIAFFFLFVFSAGIELNDSSSSSGEDITAAAAFFTAVIVFSVSSLVVGILYYCLTMMRSGDRNGQSWGKQLLGIRVIKEDGTQVGFGYAFLRQILVIQLLFGTVASWVTFGFPLALLVDYLWPLWDKGNQAVHDKMVRSRVVQAND